MYCGVVPTHAYRVEDLALSNLGRVKSAEIICSPQTAAMYLLLPENLKGVQKAPITEEVRSAALVVVGKKGENKNLNAEIKALPADEQRVVRSLLSQYGSLIQHLNCGN